MSPKVLLKSAAFRAAGFLKPGQTSNNIAPEQAQYLSKNNPVLLDLKKRYEHAEKPDHSTWSFWEKTINLHQFRGENDYLSQSYFRDVRSRYLLTAAYVEWRDELNWLDSLKEDNLFGVKTWDILPGKVITRDLLDSILEIYFLKEKLALNVSDKIRMLDIGAGYGRLAYRFTSLFPQAHVSCIDAVATSTFLSDFYLRFRGRAEQTQVVPFDKREVLQSGQFDVACNVHSWTECTLAFVKFWLELLVDLRVKYLFVVPHFSNFCTTELDGTMGNYEPELKRCGFKLMISERKFNRSEVANQFGIYPANYHLFKRD